MASEEDFVGAALAVVVAVVIKAVSCFLERNNVA